MNKRNSFVILALSSAFLLAACGEDSSQPATTTSQEATTSSVAGTTSEAGTHTVTFESNGGSAVAVQQVANGGKVARPTDPTKEGFTFLGWFEDEALVTLYDFEDPVYSDLTLYADWIENTVESSEDEGDPDTLYFCESTWWNSATGYTAISLSGQSTDYAEMVKMSYVRTVQLSATEYYNYWSVPLEEIGDAEIISFYRLGLSSAGEVEYWGAQTVDVSMNTKGENNCYSILGVDKPGAWTEGGDDNDRQVTGEWKVYDTSDATDISVPEDSSEGGEATEPYGPEGAANVAWYIVGEGTAFSGWTVEGGLQLWSNPNNVEDKGCALNVTFTEGDIFKVTNGSDIWFGYEKVDPSDSDANAGKTCFAGVDDGYGGKNFSCTVTGVYDVYVNPQGVFWIQVHA